MCQVHTGAYVLLLARGRTDYTACHPRKTITHILHVVPITTHSHDKRESIGKKETRKRKEDEGKETKDKKAKTPKRKGKKRKDEKRQDKKRKQGKKGKEKKRSY